MQKSMPEDSRNIKLNMPKIMLGTFNVESYETMDGMVKTALENKCFGFDTSPSYGTEKNLGRALKKYTDLYKSRNKLFISTKVDGIQMYKTDGSIEKYVYESLENLQLDYLDLLLVHWPFERYLEKTWQTMEKLCKKGVTKYIGLCNINERVLNNCIDKKYFKNIFPNVVQNEISPLRTCDEEIKFFMNKGLAIQAYSPLCRMIKPVKESKTLNALAEKYDKNIGQIILRWHIDRGIIPIFTSTSPKRIASNLDIFSFSLSQEDILLINNMNMNYKIFLESYGCPGI